MVNQATKHGSEALRPMSNSAVPVLFSLKNVQPLILGSSPITPAKENGQSVDAAKPTSKVAASSVKAAAAESVPSAANVTPLISRPTKVQPSSSLLRTVGTVMLILLFILVIKISFQSGSNDAKMAVATPSKDIPSNIQPESGKLTAAPKDAPPPSPMPPLPDLEISVPSLPLLSSSSKDVKSSDKTDLTPKEAGLELGGQQSDADIRLGATGLGSSALGSSGLALGAFPQSNPPSMANPPSMVPTLLAAAPSTSVPSVQPPSQPNATRDHTSVPLLNIRETGSSDIMTPYTNAPEIELAPYGAARPAIRSTNNVLETSTPNLDNVDELVSLYRKGKEGNSAPAVQTPSNVPAMQVSASNAVTQPQTPYIPLSNSNNWPTSSLAPASLTGVPSQGTNAMPSNSTVSMSGQSYPPPQPVYEPLTVPAYEQPMPNSSSSPNSFNRYQPSMIRQPNNPATAPIAQPRLPYSPVGPMATGAPGASYGYPPINVPSN